MEMDEAPLLKGPVDGLGGGVPHPHHRAEGVGAHAQVSQGAQELEAVALFLQRIVVVRVAHDLHAFTAWIS